MNMKHRIIIIIIFAALIGSDLFIGFYGHYMGTTEEDEFTPGAFVNYLAVADYTELFVVFLIAIGISLLVMWGFKQ